MELLKPGFVEWLHFGRFDHAEQILADMHELSTTQLRTGISWADCHIPEGVAWYDWLIPKLAKELEILPCLTYTPPSIAIAPFTAAPPKRSQDYADFVDWVLNRYGKYFEYVELWNEPNNRLDWDFNLDPGWKLFSQMISMAAYWVKQCGKKTVLGGMSPVDVKWLHLVGSQGALENIDVVGIHAFPGTWDVGTWQGWDYLIELTKEAIAPYTPASVWITETGTSTLCCSEETQVEQFEAAASSAAERVYWYSIRDLHPALSSQEGFHVDEKHYHFGLKTYSGKPKQLSDELRNLAGMRQSLLRPSIL